VEHVHTWLVNDQKLKDQKNAANSFINFFITVTEKLNIWQVEKRDTISILKDSFPRISPA